MSKLMKILLLNPHVSVEHSAVKTLQSAGFVVFLPANAEEAWQMLQLHGSSIDLAVVHREAAPPLNPEDGLQLLQKVKADPVQQDLPFVVTSEFWTDPEFARHQQTPQGANAYLRYPFDDKRLVETVNAVLGLGSDISAISASMAPPKTNLPSQPEIELDVSKKLQPPGAPKTHAQYPPQAPGTSSFVLQDASHIFRKPEVPRDSDGNSGGIVLENPDVPTNTTAATASASNSSPFQQSSDEGLLLVEAPAVEEGSIAIPADMPSIPTAAIERSRMMGVPLPQVPTPGQQQQEALSGLPLTSLPDELPVDGVAMEEPFQMAPLPMQPAAGFPEAPVEPAIEAVDEQVATEMPYLFGSGVGSPPKSPPPMAPSIAFVQPVGDAVVPGGAAQTPDVETLKKYLLLREQDVAVLSTQLKAAQEQVASLEKQVRDEHAKNVEFSHTVDEQKRRIEEFEAEKNLSVEGLQGEIHDLKFQVKVKTDKARLLESQVRDATEEIEHLKERVRSDIRKIRVREKELENRLEIMKKDSEALIGARESKILELKRKLDLLEFNIDLLQNKYSREKEISAKLRERLGKAAQVLRVAGGLLDSKGNPIAGSEATNAAGEPHDPEQEAS